MHRSSRPSGARAWRSWYRLAIWTSKPLGLRWQCLLRDRFTCMMCGQSYSDTSRLVADHIKPHKGDYELFTSLDNLQCLCKACHDAPKQAQDRTGITRGCDVNGTPIDKNHPWNA